jgi:hypothetical protein
VFHCIDTFSAGAVEDTFSIISQTEKFNIPVRASISSSGAAANALAQPPKGYITMPAQKSSTANRVTVLKDEPKPVPDFLARDWVVDPNLSLGEVQVSCSSCVVLHFVSPWVCGDVM